MIKVFQHRKNYEDGTIAAVSIRDTSKSRPEYLYGFRRTSGIRSELGISLNLVLRHRMMHP
jgi:hypothetical protein